MVLSGEAIVQLEICGEVVLAVTVMGDTLLFSNQKPEVQTSAVHTGDNHKTTSRTTFKCPTGRS